MTAREVRRPQGFETLRSFLRRTAPVSVVVHTELGDRTLQCKSQAWRELADTIVSMKPHGVIEAFDAKNLLLKTYDCARLGWDADDPMAPVALSSMQSDMMLFQRLIAEAYRHANETAFGQVVRLCEIAFRRLEVIEVGWTRMQKQRLKEIEQAEEAHGNGEEPFAEEVLGTMAKGMLQAQLQKIATGAAGKPDAGKPNGKGGARNGSS